MLFEIGPVFYGKESGRQLTMIGAIKTGKFSRKNWIEKERSFDVFDIKSDALRTLNVRLVLMIPIYQLVIKQKNGTILEGLDCCHWDLLMDQNLRILEKFTHQ